MFKKPKSNTNLSNKRKTRPTISLDDEDPLEAESTSIVDSGLPQKRQKTKGLAAAELMKPLSPKNSKQSYIS